MKRIFVITLLLALLLPTYAQEYKWFGGERETIEPWVFEEQGLGRYVGISNPEQDSLTAFNQALVRAWFLALADNGGLEIKMLQESFNRVYGEEDHEDLAYKYNYLAEVTVDSIPNLYFTVGREYTTIFGEKCVEIYTSPFDGGGSMTFCADSAKVRGMCYLSGTEVYRLDTDLRIDLDIEVAFNGESHRDQIDMLRVNKKRTARYIFQGDTLQNKRAGQYIYNLSDLDIAKSFKEGIFPEPVRIEDGLFTAMLETMVADIVKAPNYDFEVSSVSEDVNMESKGLVRMSYIGVLRLFQVRHIINGRNLWGKWQVSVEN